MSFQVTVGPCAIIPRSKLTDDEAWALYDTMGEKLALIQEEFGPKFKFWCLVPNIYSKKNSFRREFEECSENEEPFIPDIEGALEDFRATYAKELAMLPDAKVVYAAIPQWI